MNWEMTVMDEVPKSYVDRKPKPSKYDPIFEELAKVKDDQWFVIFMEKPDIQRFRNVLYQRYMEGRISRKATRTISVDGRLALAIREAE